MNHWEEKGPDWFTLAHIDCGCLNTTSHVTVWTLQNNTVYILNNGWYKSNLLTNNQPSPAHVSTMFPLKFTSFPGLSAALIYNPRATPDKTTFAVRLSLTDHANPKPDEGGINEGTRSRDSTGCYLWPRLKTDTVTKVMTWISPGILPTHSQNVNVGHKNPHVFIFVVST